MKKTNNIMIKAMISIFVILFLVGNVSAFAVSSAYYKNNPLRLKQGETFDFFIVLQGSEGQEDTLKANVLSGSEVLQITDTNDIYSVPGGEKKSVNLRAIIPQNAKAGSFIPISIELTTVQRSSSGEFGFGSAIEQNFNILVTREDGTTDLISKGTVKLLIILGIGIFVLGLMTILIVKRRKR